MSKRKILLVDDSPDLLKLIGARIKQWGYGLIKAQDGQEALRMAKEEDPDIIILDYMLPDSDGIKVLRQIREFNKTVPVIMFTAYPEISAMDEARDLAISAFIPKFNIYSDIDPLLKSAIHMAEKSLKGGT